MALTGKRWLEIALLGCLTLTVVYWPGSAENSDEIRATFATRPHHARQFLKSLEGELGRTLVLLQLRDRVLDSMARTRGAGPTVAFRIPDSRHAVSASRLAAASESVERLLQPSHPVIRTVILVRPDTAYRLPNGGRVPLWGFWYVMPGATHQPVCLALPRQAEFAQVAPFLVDTATRMPQDAGAALLFSLGPCAFYTAFGMPGNEIERWLRRQDYSVARRADWQYPRTPPASLQRQVEQLDFTQLNWPSMWDLLREASSGAFEMRGLNLPARACAHGRADQCQTLLFSSLTSFSAFGDVRQLRGGYGIARQLWWSREDMGGAFLSDLVRSKGREAFARFWRSTFPVDTAFRQAFGETLEAWTHRWLVGNLEQPRFGPAVRFASVWFGLALVAVAIFVASLLSMRR